MDNSLPIFSVIIATYRRQHLLPRAINSVLKQTFTDFELIIVDDSSPDQTMEVVAGFTDTRIKYIRREVNGGCPAAKNTGIRAARGKYITLLDDDDEYFPNFLAEMFQVWESVPQSVGVSWCGTQVVKETAKDSQVIEEKVWHPIFKNREEAYLSFLCARRVGGNCGLTFRRTALITIGALDERLRKADDTDLLARMVYQFDFTVISQVLIKIYHHGSGRLTMYDQTMAQAYEIILQKNEHRLNSHPTISAELHYKIGWIYYHSGNKIRGRYFCCQAIRHYPFHSKSWLALLLFEIAGQTGKRVHRNVSNLREQLSNQI